MFANLAFRLGRLSNRGSRRTQRSCRGWKINLTRYVNSEGILVMTITLYLLACHVQRNRHFRQSFACRGRNQSPPRHSRKEQRGLRTHRAGRSFRPQSLEGQETAGGGQFIEATRELARPELGDGHRNVGKGPARDRSRILRRCLSDRGRKSFRQFNSN